jgi:CSLREA domain-containing protein
MPRAARLRSSFALAFSFATGGAAAAEFSVTRADDPAPDGCTPSDCSLREAVAAANAAPGFDRIVLPASPVAYQLTRGGAGEDLNATGDLDVTGDLEIAGLGAAQAVMVQGTPDRLLHVLPDAGLWLRNLTLQGGRDVAQGGAVFIPFGRLDAADATFLGNSALESGGALRLRTGSALQGELGLSLQRVRFESNSAPRGGAIDLAGSTTLAMSARIDRGEFVANTATQQGGAIAIPQDLSQPTTVEILRSTFQQNETLGQGSAGGAIHNAAEPYATVIVRDSIFFDNHALGTGGVGGALVDVQRIERSSFSFNRATVGGAVHGRRQQIVDSQFCDNLALSQGGALSTGGANVFASTFCRNEVTGTDTLDGGGAIYVEETDTALDIVRSTLDANVARSGGAILYRGGDLTLLQSTLAAPATPPANSVGTLLRHEGTASGDLVVFLGNILRGTCSFSEGPAVLDNASHNAVAGGEGCGLLPAGETRFNNVVFADASSLPLAPLADNGGPTLTRLPESETLHPAINLVPPGSCQFPLDQRGYASNDGACDAGAVEQGGLPVADGPIFADGFEG